MGNSTRLALEADAERVLGELGEGEHLPAILNTDVFTPTGEVSANPWEGQA